jgi:hypothetical protein
MQNACELCSQLSWIGFRSECFVSSCVSVTNDVSRVCTLTWVDENAVHGNVSIGAKRVKAVCIILHMCCDRQDQQGWEFFHKSKQTLATFLLLVYDITLWHLWAFWASKILSIFSRLLYCSCADLCWGAEKKVLQLLENGSTLVQFLSGSFATS